jgi:hypothetical protein
LGCYILQGGDGNHRVQQTNKQTYEARALV